VRPKASWTDNLSHSPTCTTTASECQTLSGQIPGDQPEQGIYGYGEKDFEKWKILRRDWIRYGIRYIIQIYYVRSGTIGQSESATDQN